MRTTRLAHSVIAFGATVALASACASGEAATSGPAPAAADTVRGTLAVVGADPLAQPAIRPDDGPGEIHLTGPGAEDAATLQGMQVWASGALDPERDELEVERLEVRAVDGTAAVSGTLEREGARWYLLLDDDRRVPLRNLPDGLQEQEGERVWISAPVDVGGGSSGALP